MKKWYAVLLAALILCLFAMPVCAQEVEDDEYDDYEFEGYEGEDLPPIAPDIELFSNPSTGYHWFFTCDEPEVVEVTESGFISGQEGVLGAPGIESFRLAGCEMGTAEVTFFYARSEQETPLYTITYLVQVNDNWDVGIYQASFEMN